MTIALGDDRGGYSAAAVAVAAERVAVTLGDVRGRTVLLLARRGLDFVAGLYGIWQAGGVALPVPPDHPAAEVDYLRRDAAVVATVEALPPPRPNAEASPPPVAVAGSLLLYTSGTTARPKGVLLTPPMLAAQTTALIDAWGLHAGDRVLHALPLHHVHGLVVALLAPVWAGAMVKMLDRFDPVRVWDELGDVDVWMAVPTMYQRLFEAYDRADGPTQARWAANARRLRLATSGSAALPARYAERWRELTGAIPLERYGMTEVGIVLSNPLAADERQVGRVGRPIGGTQTRICDERGESERGPGELWLRGPTVFDGYLGKPEATAEVFVDGWFRTGDWVERDESGSLRILGRMSTDVLKSAGYKLSALEIEEALREHACVAEVAVVGLPDEALGDRVVAAIVLAPALSPPDAEGLRAWVGERLARYKVPRAFYFVSALPKNALGKVQKRLLAEELAERA